MVTHLADLSEVAVCIISLCSNLTHYLNIFDNVSCSALPLTPLTRDMSRKTPTLYLRLVSTISNLIATLLHLLFRVAQSFNYWPNGLPSEFVFPYLAMHLTNEIINSNSSLTQDLRYFGPMSGMSLTTAIELETLWQTTCVSARSSCNDTSSKDCDVAPFLHETQCLVLKQRNVLAMINKTENANIVMV